MALDVIINAAFLIVPMAIELGTMNKIPAINSCSVQIQVGMRIGNSNAVSNAGGSVPHLALWDIDGNRIGQYTGDAHGYIDDGETASYTVYNTQNGDKPAQPDYLSLSMQESDALCITMIYAQGNNAQWSWTGDMAYSCNGDWYYSNATLGSSNYQSKCAWVDSDHSNNIRAQGLSLHMRDFGNDKGMAAEWQQNTDTLCKLQPRMTFWYTIYGNSDLVAPGEIFSPPLTYVQDGDNMGADDDPSKLVYRKTSLFPDNGNEVPGQKRDKLSGKSRLGRRENRNPQPGHLVISNSDQHSAKHLCEHPTSLGPDFVSVPENVFCDMAVGEWWPLCTGNVTLHCFDLNTKTLNGNNSANWTLTGHNGLDGRAKLPYHTTETW